MGLSYTNGIGTPQQLSGAVEAASSSSVGRTERTAQSQPAGQVQSAPGGADAVDQASLSPAATAVAEALSGSDVRMDKVAALQQSIVAGTYSVPASDVADKLMTALLK